jgi:hypothetical protein
MNKREIDSLQTFLRHWIQNNSTWRECSAEDIAEELANDPDFSMVRLAGWLRAADSRLIAQIVQSVLPYPYNYGAGLLTEAVLIAARQRTSTERLRALAAGTGIAVFPVY